MHVETFNHTLPDGQPAKFSIWDTRINGVTYYYAKVVGTDLDLYVSLTPQAQEVAFGIEVSNGENATVYYRDPEKLKADLIANYGKEWLKSEL